MINILISRPYEVPIHKELCKRCFGYSGAYVDMSSQ